MTEITLLDGGMGQEITKRAGDTNSPLWSMKAMMEKPGLVEAVHREYFEAGATIAMTNTYPVHRDRLEPRGMGDLFLPLMDAALAEAAAARADFGGGRLAGAIGPLGGSYNPDLIPDPEIAAPLIAEVAGHLAPHVDLLVCETLPSLKAVDGALSGCEGLDCPVWIAVTVSDSDGSRLRSGERMADLAPLVEKYQPDAVLVNCSSPEAMEAGLLDIRDFGLPFGAYANAFERITDDFLDPNASVDTLTARRDIWPNVYADFAMHWVAMGATIIGGCCETGPAHIAEIARRLDRAGFVIV